MESLKSKLPHMAFLFGILILISSCKEEKRGLVIGKIQQASDLVVTEFVVDKVVFGKKEKNILFVPVNEASFLAYSRAKIKTGINLERIKEEDILIEGNKITLSLPPIEVINFSYPPEDFIEDSLVSNPKRFLNSINLEDQETFFRLAEMDIRDQLPYMGLVETSQNHTRKLMHTLLKNFDFEEIFIHFKSDSLKVRQIQISDNTLNP